MGKKLKLMVIELADGLDKCERIKDVGFGKHTEYIKISDRLAKSMSLLLRKMVGGGNDGK